MRVLSEADVARLLTPDLALRTAEEAYVSFSSKLTDVPPRSEIHRIRPQGTVLIMSGMIADAVLGVKVVGSVVADTAPAMRHTTCLMLIWDAATLRPRGLISADALNDDRTAAGLAVGTRYLAREESSTHVLFGTGKVSFACATYVARVRPIRRMIIVGRRPSSVEALAERLSSERIMRDVDIVTDCGPDAAVDAADIVTTATRSTQPLFDGSRTRPGTHINLAGAMRATDREMDDAVACRSNFVVDSREATLQRAGDIVIPLREGVIREAQILGEIGEVILGRVKGRVNHDEITVFRSMGIAAQDFCLASRLLDHAEESGIGQEIDL